MFEAVEYVEFDRLRDEDDQFKDKIDRHAPLAVWTIQQVTCLEYTYTLCLIQLNQVAKTLALHTDMKLEFCSPICAD